MTVIDDPIRLDGLPTSPAGFPIFDGHNDALLALDLDPRRPASLLERGTSGHLDCRGRAKTASLVGSSPSSCRQANGSGHHAAASPITMSCLCRGRPAWRARRGRPGGWPRACSAQSGSPKVGSRWSAPPASCEAACGAVLAAVLHLEGAEAIDPGLDALEILYQAGLRSLGPVWSRSNAFGHACHSSSQARRRPARG